MFHRNISTALHYTVDTGCNYYLISGGSQVQIPDGTKFGPCKTIQYTSQISSNEKVQVKTNIQNMRTKLQLARAGFMFY